MLDQGRVNQAVEGLREMHRGVLYEDKRMWYFVSTGNDFLLSEREVQVAALDKYNRELRAPRAPDKPGRLRPFPLALPDAGSGRRGCLLQGPGLLVAPAGAAPDPDSLFVAVLRRGRGSPVLVQAARQSL